MTSPNAAPVQPLSQADLFPPEPSIVDRVRARWHDLDSRQADWTAERQERRAEFQGRLGELAMVKSSITVDEVAQKNRSPELEEAIATTAFGHANASTRTERLATWRLQRKVEKHHRKVSHDTTIEQPRLFRTLRRTLRRESEIEALKRNNGLPDVRLNTRATLRGIEQAKRQAVRERRQGIITQEEYQQRLMPHKKGPRMHGHAEGTVYRTDVRMFNTGARAVAEKRRERSSRSLYRYAAKRLTDEQMQAIGVNIDDTPRGRITKAVGDKPPISKITRKRAERNREIAANARRKRDAITS